MKKMQELVRKALATIIAVSVMCAMLWFAYTMLIETPIFEGTLRLVLLVCIGILSLATIYFFICKIIEIIALLRAPKGNKQTTEIKTQPAEEQQAATKSE